MADQMLLLKILSEMDPGRLGQLISQVQDPQRFLGQGIFDKGAPGMQGGNINLRGPIRSFGTGVPEVRR